MQSRWARVARGTAAASAATFVAAFSHWLAGGAAPSLFGVGASFVLSAMVCSMLAGRALSTPRLAASICLSQLMFHALFSGLGTPVLAHHDMAAMALGAESTHAHASPAMWAGHAVAAVVTIVAFRFGERAFWGVAETARLFLARLFVAAVPVLQAPRPVVSGASRFEPRDLALLLSSMRHRGPPVELTA